MRQRHLVFPFLPHAKRAKEDVLVGEQEAARRFDQWRHTDCSPAAQHAMVSTSGYGRWRQRKAGALVFCDELAE